MLMLGILLTRFLKDPLNLPQWHKWTITIVLGLCKRTQKLSSRHCSGVILEARKLLILSIIQSPFCL